MNRKTDDLPMTKALGLRLRNLDQARKFAALRSRGEPSVPARLAFAFPTSALVPGHLPARRQLRRKWHCRRDAKVLARIRTNVSDIGVPSDGDTLSRPKPQRAGPGTAGRMLQLTAGRF
jgi:hypothetical protein